MRGAGVVLVAASIAGLFLLPAAAAFGLSLLAAIVEPLAPAMVGLLADALYAPSLHAAPLYTLLGVTASCAAYSVHKHVKASIIR